MPYARENFIRILIKNSLHGCDQNGARRDFQISLNNIGRFNIDHDIHREEPPQNPKAKKKVLGLRNGGDNLFFTIWSEAIYYYFFAYF